MLREFGGSATPGQSPSGLAFGTDGLLYGTTEFGRTNGVGTLYRMSTTGALYETLQSFNCGSRGCKPTGTLTLGADGRLYGTTSEGASFNGGTAFAITTANQFTVLRNFANGAEGTRPTTDLVRSANGFFLGMTHEGGATTLGTIFEITATGFLVSVTNVPGNGGAAPRAALTRGNDGLYYGTTMTGGSRNLGTVFNMDAHGVVTTLHEFTGLDVANPTGTLILGSDDYFYGTTSGGGANLVGVFNSYGTVFRIDRSGDLTTLHSFSGTDGYAPYAGLVQGTDGAFYGTTSGHFPASVHGGTVFRIDSAGTFRTLHFFDSTNGGFPSVGIREPYVEEPTAIADERDRRAVRAEARLHVKRDAAGQPRCHSQSNAVDRHRVEIAQQIEHHAPAVGTHVHVHPRAFGGVEGDRAGRPSRGSDIPFVAPRLREGGDSAEGQQSGGQHESDRRHDAAILARPLVLSTDRDGARRRWARIAAISARAMCSDPQGLR